VKAIIAYLQSAIRYLETRKSVATLTAHLSDTIKDLEAHAAEQIAVAKGKTLEAARLLKERAEHEEEHLKATKVAQNIKALLG
jgi:hypothetical protein